MQPRNLAARAGRWSATHRKTAILGWILFVVLATMVGGNVGQKNLEQAASGNGDSKRGSMIVDDAGFPNTVGERVLVQGKGSVKADSPEVTAAVKDVVSRLGKLKGVSDIQSPLDAQYRASTVSKDGRSVLVTYSLPAKVETAQDLEKLEPLVKAPLAEVAAVQKAHPELLVQEHGDASQQHALGPKDRASEAKSDELLHGRHAAPPPAHVRRRRRGRRPAAAGRQLVRGDHRPARPGQPAHPAASCRPAGDDAHRPRRRRRLRDVLHAPDDRGARQGPLVGRRARRGRRDLGSCGADLRVHRHGGDGRHVLLGQPDLLLVRHRHDPRGPRGHDRLAHVPPRGAVLPRPEELAREGPRARTSPSAATRTAASPACGTRSSTASSSTRSSRSCSPAACWSR